MLGQQGAAAAVDLPRVWSCVVWGCAFRYIVVLIIVTSSTLRGIASSGADNAFASADGELDMDGALDDLDNLEAPDLDAALAAAEQAAASLILLGKKSEWTHSHPLTITTATQISNTFLHLRHVQSFLFDVF